MPDVPVLPDGTETSTATLSRRTLLKAGIGATGALLLGASTGSTPAEPAAAPADEASLYAEAKKEGKVVWWTAHYQLDAAEAVRDAFVAKYPGIEFQFIRQTAQVVYQRLSQNLKAGVREVDVFASTDEAHYLTLKNRGSSPRTRRRASLSSPKPSKASTPTKRITSVRSALW